MSVRLRLRKTGTRNQPSYRIVATDSRSPRDGRFIEILGFYDPRGHQEKIDLERAKHWISVGAQPSETVGDIIKRAEKGASLTVPAKPVIQQTPAREKAAPAAAEAATTEA